MPGNGNHTCIYFGSHDWDDETYHYAAWRYCRRCERLEEYEDRARPAPPQPKKRGWLSRWHW